MRVTGIIDRVSRRGGALALVAALSGCSAADDVATGVMQGGGGATGSGGAFAGGGVPGAGGAGMLPPAAGGALVAPGSGGTTSPGAGGQSAAGGAPAGGAGGVVAGAGGATGGTSGAGNGGGGAGGAATHPDLGVGDGTDVVLLGDSWMSNTLQIEGTGGGIAPSLIAVSKKPYRNYAVQGVMLLQADTFGPAIPSQWDQAKRVNPTIKTVVMTGGGNDIIQNPTIQQSCTAGTDACKQLFDQISDALNDLWTKMADSGVQDIVYIQYASDVGTVNASLRGQQKTPAICLTGKVRCHAVDTTSTVQKQIAGDGIHPLKAANDRVAQQVYDLMTSEGMRR